MPELPEVQIIVQTLKTQLLGKKIIDTQVFYEPIVNKIESFQQLKDKTILDIQRKGKFLLFFFTGELVLVGHLRMEGKLFVKPKNINPQKHEHFVLIFEDDLSLRYYDFRKFGRFEVHHYNSFLTKTTLGRLALDPFEIKALDLWHKIKKTKSAIKKVLLNQEVISGLGNIYVNEVLFLASIHPEIQASKLTLLQIENLLNICKKVLTQAIHLGGTTISTFESQPGIKGYFQNKLMVHGKINQPCYKCQNLITKIKVGGRGTYICSLCQQLPIV